MVSLIMNGRAAVSAELEWSVLDTDQDAAGDAQLRSRQLDVRTTPNSAPAAAAVSRKFC
jgi:hypothetical protein